MIPFVDVHRSLFAPSNYHFLWPSSCYIKLKVTLSLAAFLNFVPKKYVTWDTVALLKKTSFYPHLELIDNCCVLLTFVSNEALGTDSNVSGQNPGSRSASSPLEILGYILTSWAKNNFCKRILSCVQVQSNVLQEWLVCVCGVFGIPCFFCVCVRVRMAVVVAMLFAPSPLPVSPGVLSCDVLLVEQQPKMCVVFYCGASVNDTPRPWLTGPRTPWLRTAQLCGNLQKHHTNVHIQQASQIGKLSSKHSHCIW